MKSNLKVNADNYFRQIARGKSNYGQYQWWIQDLTEAAPTLKGSICLLSVVKDLEANLNKFPHLKIFI